MPATADVALTCLACNWQARLKDMRRQHAKGPSFNDRLKSSRDFHNPAAIESALRKFELDQYGTNLPHDVYDPNEFDMEDYYPALAREQDALRTQRDAERKLRDSITFQSAGVLPGQAIQAGLRLNAVAAAAAVSNRISVLPVAGAANVAASSRRSKSKWDQPVAGTTALDLADASGRDANLAAVTSLALQKAQELASRLSAGLNPSASPPP